MALRCHTLVLSFRYDDCGLEIRHLNRLFYRVWLERVGMARSGLIFSLVVVVGAGLALRLWNFGVRRLTHPEIHAPGIDLAARISKPPPRHALRETVRAGSHGLAGQGE